MSMTTWSGDIVCGTHTRRPLLKLLISVLKQDTQLTLCGPPVQYNYTDMVSVVDVSGDL